MAEKKTGLKKEQTSVSQQLQQQFAVVLVRGFVGMDHSIKKTLIMLRLHRKNTCVVVGSTPAVQGMLVKVKDYVTWGPVSEPVFIQLLEKRGREFSGRLTDTKSLYDYKTLKYDRKDYLPYFYLNPPRKGFGRKGIKRHFNVGGALGYRGEKMDDLLQRMI